MAKKSVKDILAEVMPEMEIVEGQQAKLADAAEEATTPGPSLAELRRKYLGFDDETAGLEGLGPRAADAPNTEDVVVVQVRPKAAATDPNVPATPKTIVVSRKTGKIIARQG